MILIDAKKTENAINEVICQYNKGLKSAGNTEDKISWLKWKWKRMGAVECRNIVACSEEVEAIPIDTLVKWGKETGNTEIVCTLIAWYMEYTHDEREDYK